MPSKLKRRRWRRMRDDLAWYKDEAKDLHCRLMELADELQTFANRFSQNLKR